MQDLAYRLSGSSDLYGDDGRYPYASINFVTAHDGFTLRDLVSYDHKHNEANHEDNRDGTDDNRSWNCGVEGETDDAAVIALRKRQMANLMSTLVLSTGVPMITAGDECGRTQDGNNNAYCQDSEISWFDWSLPAAWSDHLALTKKLLALRAAHPTLRQWHYFSGQPVVPGGRKDLSWIAPHGGEMTEADWHDGNLRTIGMFLAGDALRGTDAEGNVLTDNSFLLALNATAETREVVVPDASWAPAYEVVLDTSNSGVDRGRGRARRGTAARRAAWCCSALSEGCSPSACTFMVTCLFIAEGDQCLYWGGDGLGERTTPDRCAASGGHALGRGRADQLPAGVPPLVDGVAYVDVQARTYRGVLEPAERAGSGRRRTALGGARRLDRAGTRRLLAAARVRRPGAAMHCRRTGTSVARAESVPLRCADRHVLNDQLPLLDRTAAGTRHLRYRQQRHPRHATEALPRPPARR